MFSILICRFYAASDSQDVCNNENFRFIFWPDGLTGHMLTSRSNAWYAKSMKQPLSINLSPDLERFVKEKVKTGQYPSATHLVSGALQALKTHERLTKSDVGELRREIGVGIDQLDRGQSAAWNVRAIKARLRQSLKRKK